MKGQLLTLVLLLGGLSGCISLPSKLGRQPTIAQVQSQRANTEVQLSGIVVQQAPFLQGGGYALQDKTGTVWVLTDRDLPELETKVSITGVIQAELVEFGDRLPSKIEFYIQEQERQ